MLEANGVVMTMDRSATSVYASEHLKRSWLRCPSDERIIVHPEWERVLEARMQALGISRRKREVLWHLMAGLNTTQIADALYIRPKTVKGHISQVYDKLHLVSDDNAEHRTHMRTHVLLFLLGIDTAELRATLQAKEVERQ
jgi:DNA-binding CsgD family transcriptional regulator